MSHNHNKVSVNDSMISMSKCTSGTKRGLGKQKRRDWQSKVWKPVGWQAKLAPRNLDHLDVSTGNLSPNIEHVR